MDQSTTEISDLCSRFDEDKYGQRFLKRPSSEKLGCNEVSVLDKVVSKICRTVYAQQTAVSASFSFTDQKQALKKHNP